MPAGRRWKRLEEWFAARVERLTVLDFDRATASRWARRLADLRRKRRSMPIMPIKDSLIAATALVHGLSVTPAHRMERSTD